MAIDRPGEWLLTSEFTKYDSASVWLNRMWGLAYLYGEEYLPDDMKWDITDRGRDRLVRVQTDDRWWWDRLMVGVVTFVAGVLATYLRARIVSRIPPQNRSPIRALTQRSSRSIPNISLSPPFDWHPTTHSA